MRKKWWVVVAVAAVGIGAWWLFSRDPGSASSVTVSSAPDDGGAAADPGATAGSSSSSVEKSDSDDELSGVVTFAGQPVSGADVRLFSMPAKVVKHYLSQPNDRACGPYLKSALAAIEASRTGPLQRTSTDGDGRFTFKVEKGVRYAATVTSGDLMEGVWGVHAGEHLRLGLERVEPITGEILFPDGGPASGAQLTAYAQETGDARESFTDERGQFTLLGPMAKNLLVRVVAAGFEPQVIDRPGGEFTLMHPGVTGRVELDGVGVGGAVVTVDDQRAVSQSDGTYVFTGFPCAVDEVRARLDQRKGKAPVGKGTVELQRVGRITVLLSSTSPALLAGATCKVSEFREKNVAPSRQTQSSAVFEDLVPSIWYLEVSAPGLAAVAQSIKLEAGEDREVRLELNPPVAILGVVIDATTAKPLEGVALMAWAKGAWPLAQPDTRSDAEGRFRFEGANPGRYFVKAAGLGYLETTQEVTAGEVATVRLSRGTRVTGRVSFEGLTRPPPDYVVTVVPRTDESAKNLEPLARVFLGQREGNVRDGNSGLGGVSLSLDDTGDFSASPSLPGDYLLFASSEDRAWGIVAQQVELRADADVHVELVVPRGLTITGKVLDPRGKGAHGEVTAIQDDTESRVSADTARDGTFTLKGLRKGDWALEARSFDDDSLYASADVQSGATDVVLRLYKPRLLRARVLARGAPVSRVTVTGRLGQRVVDSETELTDGELKFRLPLESGEFILESDGLKSKPLQFPASGDVVLGDVTLQ